MTEDPPRSSKPPPPSVQGQLLATLLSQGTLVQPEVALTRATQFLLGLPGATNALDALVEQAGLQPEADGHWLTEVRNEEGGRTDLEYRWGDPDEVHVVVEAKIGHTLAGGQIDAYRPRLGDHGLLVVLVPVTRRREGDRVVAELRAQYEQASDRVRVALWTWDDVVAALETALPEQPDVAQLRGLVARAGALDIPSFGEGELVTSDASRFDDLWSVLNRASAEAGFPAQYGGYFQRHRYYPVGDFDAHLSVGIGRVGRTDPEPWIWVRVWDRSHLALVQQDVLKDRTAAERDGDCLAFPLDLEPGMSGYELTESLREQLQAIAFQVREGLRKALAETDSSHTAAESKTLAPLVGMSGFASEDLLDSNPARTPDLEIVLNQVCRHIFSGRVGRWVRADEAFTKRNWIGINPYRSHLSIGFGRADEGPDPRPWAWLSVHEVTPQFDVVVQALEASFPGEVVEIPRGRGRPFTISDGSNGVDAFNSIVAQVEAAKSAVRKALETAARD